MGTRCISPRLPGSGLQKWGCPSERWNEDLMLSYSLTNTLDEIEAPHQSIILHEMFLHAAKQGQKEAERFI